MEGVPAQPNELQLVIFKVGDEEFGVEISRIKEIVRLVPVTPVPKAPSFIEGVVSLRGQILAVVDLAKRLNLSTSGRSDNTRIIVLEIQENIIGMIVDQVVEVVRLPKENIGDASGLFLGGTQSEYLKGVGRLGERIIIIIDLAKIFSSEEVEDLKKTQG